MIESILLAISQQTPFSYEAVKAFYDEFPSLDALVVTCEYCAACGVPLDFPLSELMQLNPVDIVSVTPWPGNKDVIKGIYKVDGISKMQDGRASEVQLILINTQGAQT